MVYAKYVLEVLHVVVLHMCDVFFEMPRISFRCIHPFGVAALWEICWSIPMGGARERKRKEKKSLERSALFLLFFYFCRPGVIRIFHIWEDDGRVG